MKQLFHSLLIVVLIVCSNCNMVSAQQMPPIPVDPNVRIGKLENGLTYYIRKNNLPENRIDFYIAQKVGAIQEEKDQRGLAHFLEHMCFNGTKHFPGNSVIQYLETIGVKFGVNLNAYTAIDETVYWMSNVPAVRESVVDSCLLILHDWSNDLLLNEEEIDKERGVINQEWRTQVNAMERLQEKMLPLLYAGTKYADCLPIGNMDVVMNFKYQTLRDYYEKWYRPDLQGIVIVGDVDVDAIEAKIKSIFADIPAQPNAAERIYYPVNTNKEPIIAIVQDKEQPDIQALLFCKHEATPRDQKGNLGYLVGDYATTLIGNMLSSRLEELRRLPNPPFIFASAHDGNFFATNSMDAFLGMAACKEDDIPGGIESMMREVERARRFGFTESEYTRARAEYLRQLESAFNEKDKNKNESYAEQYVRNFLDNEPIPGIENEYAIINQVAPAIPLVALNQIMQTLVTDSNQVVVLLAPEKEGLKLPTEADILAIMNKVKAEELTAYEDKVSDEPLIAELPKPGKIVSETKDEQFGTTNLTLSNGVKVIIKQTDFKADEIQMKGVSLGGNSLFPDSEIANMQALNEAARAGGLGNFSPVDLDKALAGKKASVTANVGNKTEAVAGSCSPKDFETMMQLTYLAFTAPRKDAEAFTSYKNRTKAALQNQELQPMVAFIDSINSGIYMNNPRTQRLKSAMIDQLDYDKIMAMYQDRFKDASDFTFILVGNVNIEEMKPLIEQYLGALPAINRKETFKDNHVVMRQGVFVNEFIKEQETAKATVLVYYNGKCSYNLKNSILLSVLDQVLTLVYTEKIREDEGGSYSVGAIGQLDKYPQEVYRFQVFFETDPARKDQLKKIALDEIDTVMKEGPSEANLNKAKEFMLKEYKENQKENAYWLGAIDDYLFTGTNMVAGYEEIVQSISAKDIQTFANDLFKQNNKIEVIMVSPEKK